MVTQEEIEAVGSWFHNVRFPNGLETLPGVANPRPLWHESIQFLGDLQGKTVLDIGCNGGYLEAKLEPMGAKVTAVDLQDKFINQTNLVKRGFDLTCEVFRADVEEFHIMPAMAGRKFDIVLFLGVIYHVNNPMRAMTNALNMAKDYVLVESAISPLKGSVAEYLNNDHYLNTWLPSRDCLLKLIDCCGGEVQAELVRPSASSRRFFQVTPTGKVRVPGRDS